MDSQGLDVPRSGSVQEMPVLHWSSDLLRLWGNDVSRSCRNTTGRDVFHNGRSIESDSTLMLDIFERNKYIWQNRNSRSQLRKELLPFLRHLFQYKSRQLTYEDDSLNAFKGVLSRSPFYTLWGIPIIFGLGLRSQSESANMSFAVALWWPPSTNNGDGTRRPARRRPGCPSSSWVGWAGGIKGGIPGDLNSYP